MWENRFLECHFGPCLGQVEREIIPALFLRDAAELCIVRDIMECPNHRAISFYRQIITDQIGDLFPQ